MKVLFLTIAFPQTLDHRNIHSDLMEEFATNGHQIYVVCSRERRQGKKSEVEEYQGIKILRLRTLNITRTRNWIEKGLSMILLPSIMIRGIKKFFPGIQFELVLYSTPPITYNRILRYLKQEFQPVTYLLLKDITPQNAIDMGMLRENSLLCQYFKWKEKQLYGISDFIGCMSPANIKFLLKNNPEVSSAKVEICANSMRIREKDLSIPVATLKSSLNIPADKVVVLYGGNLGKPQGIEFLLEVLKENQENQDIFFLVIGSGTEYKKIRDDISTNNYSNVRLMDYIAKQEYDEILRVADIGLLFLDKRFTIPNFPTRVLDYMEYNIPVLAATDKATDIGMIMETNKCGYGVLHGDLESFQNRLHLLIEDEELRREMGYNARQLFEKEYTTGKAYSTIVSHCN